jgi:N-acylglucosamine 2-epimerase
MLQPYLERYRRDLFSSVIPFWLKYSLDREYGGYFTCLDRDGTVYDTKKYIWLQGRQVWMFSRLYNEVERRQEYLDAAQLGVDFLRRYARDPQGRVYFSLTREGQPFFYQRKPYAAVFMMQGLLEWAQASGDEDCRREAVELFWRIREWIADPTLMGRPVLPGQPPLSNLSNVMVLASMAIELAQVDDDPRYRHVMAEALAGVQRHYDARRRILVENVALDGRDLSAWPEGRLFLPGHSIEVAWFVLHLLRFLPDAALQQLALDVIEGSLELGWDQEYGGLYYFMDLAGKPPLQLEASMKLWWPHTEAIYALVLAYTLTHEERWLRWLDRVDRYAYAHFADPEYGEWFGYCDRRGHLTHTCKGGNYKGCFHVPRALLFSIQRMEEALR